MAVYDYKNNPLDALYDSSGNELEKAYNIEDKLIYSKTTLTGITASYSGGTVVAGTTLDQLNGITVTANYSDGSAAVVTDYDLSGNLTPGQDNTVTVTYQGKTATFTVTVEAELVVLTGISVVYTGGSVAAGTTLDQLTGITVTANYSDGSTVRVASGDYTLSGTLTAGQANNVTATYQGMMATFTVTVESEEPVATGFRFYVPGLDNAPEETAISSTVYNQDAAAWYQAYDDIAAQSNVSGNYTVTCSLDDADAPHAKAADGTTDLRYYVFTPKSGTYEKTYILHAGTHSSEKNAMLSCWRICTILCTIDLTKDINPTLKYVCQNVRFIVNPLVNPAMSLSNSNGVNTNRNYDGWWSRTTGNGESGMYPFSEPEMRFVRDTIQYIGEDNIHAGLDMHNGQGSSEDYWVCYTYNIPNQEDNIRKLVAKCIYDDVNGSTTSYLPDDFMDDDGNLVTDMVGSNMIIGGTAYKTPHCMDSMTGGCLDNFSSRALNIPLQTCEVLKYRDAGAADLMNKSVKIYMNRILMDCISKYDRLVDSIDDTKPFRITWCGGIQEKYFTTGMETNILSTTPNCQYSFTSNPGVYNGFKYLAKDRSYDFESAYSTGEILLMRPENEITTTETPVEYEKLLTESEFQITGTYQQNTSVDSVSISMGYFTLLPESGKYSKTIVLYGGQNNLYNTRISDTNATIYKFLKILRDYSGVHTKLSEIRNNCRIIVIPCLVSGRPEDGGYANGNTAQTELCNMLTDIGTVDLFVQIWAINTANNGYKYNKRDADGNTLERLCMADTGSAYGLKLAQMVDGMNDNETSAVRYELTGAIWGTDETVKTNSLLHYLKNNGYVKDAVRIMPTIDLTAKAYADARFNVSGGSESTTATISVADFQKLNSETARRVSMLVNVIGASL